MKMLHGTSITKTNMIGTGEEQRNDWRSLHTPSLTVVIKTAAIWRTNREIDGHSQDLG